MFFVIIELGLALLTILNTKLLSYRLRFVKCYRTDQLLICCLLQALTGSAVSALMQTT